MRNRLDKAFGLVCQRIAGNTCLYIGICERLRVDVNGLALSLEVRFLGLGWVSGWASGWGF